MAASGQIHSLNYKTEVQDNKPNQLANLNYAICIRMESGFCGIRYSQVDNFSFAISGDAAPVRISHFTGIFDKALKFKFLKCFFFKKRLCRTYLIKKKTYFSK